MMTPTIAARAALTWVERCGLEVDEKSIHQQARQMSTMVSCLRYWSRMVSCLPSRDGDVFPLLIEMKPVLPSRRVEQEVPKKEIKVEVRVVVAPEHADAAPGRRVSVAQSSTRAPRTGGPQEKRPSSPPDASTLGAGRPEASTKKRRQTLSLD